MQRMLEASGAFDYLCPTDSKVPCPTMSTTIVQINFVATTTNTLTPFMGQAIDSYGAPKVATYFMSPIAILGAWIVYLTSTHAISESYYFLGFSCLGLATFCGSLLSVQVGLYFSGKMQVRVIMFLNALFDAGSVTYLLLWYAMDLFSVGFDVICLAYLILAIILYGGGVIFWNTAVPESALEDETNGETSNLLEVAGTTASLDADEEHDLHFHNFKERQKVRESMREYQAAHMENPDSIRDTMLKYRASTGVSDQLADNIPEYGAAMNAMKDHDEDFVPIVDEQEYVMIADRSPKDQLLSWPFVMLTLFFSINMISCNWTLATAADFLAQLGDTNGTYLSLFTILQPASVFALPLVDHTVHKSGFGTAFQCVNGLTFTYILIKLTSKSLNVQIVTFIMVAVVRCYLFAVTFSYLPRLLSPDTVGKGTGFLYMVGGVASFVNIPLNSMVLETGFFPPNLLYFLLTIPTTFMAMVVQMTIRKETRAQKAKDLAAVS
jgi:hypothetical protein